ncbi:tetratricopeptide repeat protein [Streptomyces sp. 303MFCol5.2]|uniref:tetratricopeptide repeat protein n=1 Tax=Streptomyces sp. 303MFCol5.2 TaxID=1172181 RepID=UPI00037C20A8|nr:tetratricopeptide repeat protein [Streptomyces sp. 303MFCol5.2]
MSGLFDRRAAADASGAGAVAAGGSIAQAITGPGAIGLHIDHVGMLLPDACPPPESVDCPPNLTNLPFRAHIFVGRDEELGLLRSASAEPGRSLAHVLHGLGGIGKSTLAARLASAHGPADAPVWWITADSRAAIDAGLADLAAALRPSLVTLLPQEQLSEWGGRWLATHGGWLIVLDNVTSSADVTALLSRASTGRFLITSRRATGWQGIAEEVPLSVLSSQDAVGLFTEIHGEDPDAAELCEELGCLPLAVAQAAAYCRETDCAVRTYLDDLATSPAEMYAETHEDGDHERTVARVWHVTLDRLAAEPLAVRILLMLAWYAPDGIPRSLFTSLGSSLAVRRALGRLAAHSMITLSGDTVSVHRLVQAVSRTGADGDRHRSPEAVANARTAAVDALARALPEDVEDPSAWPVMRSLLPHVEALAELVPPEADTEAMAHLLTESGDYMLGVGVKVALRALDLLRRAEAGYVRHQGPEAERTLFARVRLAHATRMMKSVEEAAPFAEEVLADCTRILGPEHGVTLLAMGNMHRIASLQGEVERAQRLAESCVVGQIRLRGQDHPRTFAARRDTIAGLVLTGRAAQARDLCGELLADCVRVLGGEHPETLATRILDTQLTTLPDLPDSLIQPLAGVLRAVTGDGLVAALRAMEEKVRALGPEWFAQASPATEDEVSAAEHDLDTCRRVLGDDHVDTVAARFALLQVYLATRDERYGEAAEGLLTEVFSLMSENESAAALLSQMFEALSSVADEFSPPPNL